MDDLDALVQLAEAATPGPWEYGTRWLVAGVLPRFGEGKCTYCDRFGEPSWTGQRDINGKQMLTHVHTSETTWHPHGMYAIRDDGPICIINDTDEYGYLDSDDAAFIAACDPQTILALVRRVKEAEAAARDWKQIATGNAKVVDSLRAGIRALADKWEVKTPPTPLGDGTFAGPPFWVTELRALLDDGATPEQAAVLPEPGMP